MAMAESVRDKYCEQATVTEERCNGIEAVFVRAAELAGNGDQRRSVRSGDEETEAVIVFTNDVIDEPAAPALNIEVTVGGMATQVSSGEVTTETISATNYQAPSTAPTRPPTNPPINPPTTRPPTTRPPTTQPPTTRPPTTRPPTPAPVTHEPTPPPAVVYCPQGYSDFGTRYNWGLGKVVIVRTHQECSDRCTRYSGPQYNGGCKAYMSGMYFGMLFCRSYGGASSTFRCAQFAHPTDRGMDSGPIGYIHPQTGQRNLGGNCCTNTTF